MNAASNIRKLAAIDILFLGFKFALAEYVFGVLFSIALGIFVLFRGHTTTQIALGIYFISLGINYVPMVVNTISLANNENAAAELGDELNEKYRAMSKYRRLSLFLLVPLVFPIRALSTLRRKQP